MATLALTEKAVVVRPEDDVAIAKSELLAGTRLEDGSAWPSRWRPQRDGTHAACFRA